MRGGANAGLRAFPPETKEARLPVSRDCNLHVGSPFIVEQDAGHPNPSAFLRSHLFGFVPRDGSQPTRRCEIVADAAVQRHQRCGQAVQRPCASKFGALCSIKFRVCFRIHVFNRLRAICARARVCYAIPMHNHTNGTQGMSRNHSAQMTELSMVVADVHDKVASLSMQLNKMYSLNSAMHSAAPSDKQAAAESAARDRGKSFKSCVARSLANKVETWSQTNSDSKDQLKVAVERRLQLSDVATRCGGHRMFAAAAASTIDDYTKWAAEEMKKDDGSTSKVVNARASTACACL
jgi:hypothetical protein